jgi:hypothetical protein
LIWLFIQDIEIKKSIMNWAVWNGELQFVFARSNVACKCFLLVIIIRVRYYVSINFFVSKCIKNKGSQQLGTFLIVRDIICLFKCNNNMINVLFSWLFFFTRKLIVYFSHSNWSIWVLLCFGKHHCIHINNIQDIKSILSIHKK